MIDERFLMHRLKSATLAAIAGCASMGGYTLYELYTKKVIHTDLIIFLFIMASVKIGALLYFRIKN